MRDIVGISDACQAHTVHHTKKALLGQRGAFLAEWTFGFVVRGHIGWFGWNVE